MAKTLGPVKRGDTITLKIKVRQPPDISPSGAMQDLTGCKLYATLKLSTDDADPGLGQVTSPASGIVIDTPATLGTATATFPASVTDGLSTPTEVFWDVQLKDAAGQIRTVADGTMTVQPDVTRTTA